MMTREELARLERCESLIKKARAAAKSFASALEITFIYREGDPGPLAPNVFNDWPTLMAAVNKVEGFRVIEIQNDFVPIPTIPAGIYDFRSVILTASFNQPTGNTLQCNLADGVQFLNFRNVRNNLLLNSLSTSVPVFELGPEPVIIERGGGIKSDPTATVPFVHVPVTGTGPIVLFDGGTIGGPGPSSATVSVDAGAQVIMILDLAAGVANNVIVGAGTAFLVVASQSAFINTPFPITQGGIGTLTVLLFFFAQLTQTDGPTQILNPANWVPPKPPNVLEALNRMATLVVALNGGAPIP